MASVFCAGWAKKLIEATNRKDTRTRGLILYFIIKKIQGFSGFYNRRMEVGVAVNLYKSLHWYDSEPVFGTVVDAYIYERIKKVRKIRAREQYYEKENTDTSVNDGFLGNIHTYRSIGSYGGKVNFDGVEHR
jgi:hypothetical protein